MATNERGDRIVGMAEDRYYNWFKDLHRLSDNNRLQNMSLSELQSCLTSSSELVSHISFKISERLHELTDEVERIRVLKLEDSHKEITRLKMFVETFNSLTKADKNNNDEVSEPELMDELVKLVNIEKLTIDEASNQIKKAIRLGIIEVAKA